MEPGESINGKVPTVHYTTKNITYQINADDRVHVDSGCLQWMNSR